MVSLQHSKVTPFLRWSKTNKCMEQTDSQIQARMARGITRYLPHSQWVQVMQQCSQASKTQLIGTGRVGNNSFHNKERECMLKARIWRHQTIELSRQSIQSRANIRPIHIEAHQTTVWWTTFKTNRDKLMKIKSLYKQGILIYKMINRRNSTWPRGNLPTTRCP